MGRQSRALSRMTGVHKLSLLPPTSPTAQRSIASPEGKVRRGRHDVPRGRGQRQDHSPKSQRAASPTTPAAAATPTSPTKGILKKRSVVAEAPSATTVDQSPAAPPVTSDSPTTPAPLHSSATWDAVSEEGGDAVYTPSRLSQGSIWTGHRRSTTLQGMDLGSLRDVPSESAAGDSEDEADRHAAILFPEAAGLERLGVHQLQELVKMFADYGEKSRELTMEEFLRAYHTVTRGSSGLKDSDLQLLFMRIDANASGAIDWDELAEYFSAFIQHEAGGAQWERNRDLHSSHVPYRRPQKHILHRGRVSRILRHPSLDRYYTCGEDGTVKMWNSTTLDHEGTIHNGEACCSDMIYLKELETVVVATVDNLLTMYHARTGKLRTTLKGKQRLLPPAICKETTARPQFRLPIPTPKPTFFGLPPGGLEGTKVMQMMSLKENNLLQRMWAAEKVIDTFDVLQAPDMVYAPFSLTSYVGSDSKELIVAGLEDGQVQLYDFPTEETMRYEGVCFARSKYPVHSATVTALATLQDRECFMSGSLDSHINVVHVERNTVLTTLQGNPEGVSSTSTAKMSPSLQARILATEPISRHQRGVLRLSYCHELKMLASVGMERHVLLWNPFVTKPLAALPGHTGRVVDAVFNPADHQIITLSSDRTVRVWDARTFRMLQQEKDNDLEKLAPPGALLFDPKRDALLTASIRLYVRPMVRAVNKQVQMDSADCKHKAEVIAAIYNAKFDQILTADPRCVKVWNAATQQLAMSFTVQHEQVGGIVSGGLCFDASQRRVVVACINSELQVWNYGCGQLLTTMEAKIAPSDDKGRSQHVEVGRNEAGVMYTVKKDGSAASFRVVIAAGSHSVRFYSDDGSSSTCAFLAVPLTNIGGASAMTIIDSLGMLVFGTALGGVAVLLLGNIHSYPRCREATPLPPTRPRYVSLRRGPLHAPVPSFIVEADAKLTRARGGESAGRVSRGVETSLSNLAERVESIVYLRRTKYTVITANGKGEVKICNVHLMCELLSWEGTLRVAVEGHAPEAIFSLEIDSTGDRLFTGDESGYLSTYDISAITDDPSTVVPTNIIKQHCFRAASDGITAMKYLEKRDLLLVGSLDKSVSLVTADGRLAAVLGQSPDPVPLHSPERFAKCNVKHTPAALKAYSLLQKQCILTLLASSPTRSLTLTEIADLVSNNSIFSTEGGWDWQQQGSRKREVLERALQGLLKEMHPDDPDLMLGGCQLIELTADGSYRYTDEDEKKKQAAAAVITSPDESSISVRTPQFKEMKTPLRKRKRLASLLIDSNTASPRSSPTSPWGNPRDLVKHVTEASLPREVSPGRSPPSGFPVPPLSPLLNPSISPLDSFKALLTPTHRRSSRPMFKQYIDDDTPSPRDPSPRSSGSTTSPDAPPTPLALPTTPPPPPILITQMFQEEEHGVGAEGEEEEEYIDHLPKRAAAEIGKGETRERGRIVTEWYEWLTHEMFASTKSFIVALEGVYRQHLVHDEVRVRGGLVETEVAMRVALLEAVGRGSLTAEWETMLTAWKLQLNQVRDAYEAHREYHHPIENVPLYELPPQHSRRRGRSLCSRLPRTTPRVRRSRSATRNVVRRAEVDVPTGVQFNEQFQRLVEAPCPTPSAWERRAEAINTLCRRFEEVVTPMAMTVVDELTLPDERKSIKRWKGAGSRWLYHSKGFGFKLLTNPASVKAHTSCLMAMKTGSAELRASTELVKCQMGTPLCCVVTYHSHRVYVSAVSPTEPTVAAGGVMLPTSPHNGFHTLHLHPSPDRYAAMLLDVLSDQLNLSPITSTARLSRRGTRLIVFNAANALLRHPPRMCSEPPLLYMHPVLTMSSPARLSPFAFSPLVPQADRAAADRNATRLWKRVTATLIPQLVHEITESSTRQSDLESGKVLTLLKAKGLSCHHLGGIASALGKGTRGEGWINTQVGQVVRGVRLGKRDRVDLTAQGLVRPPPESAALEEKEMKGKPAVLSLLKEEILARACRDVLHEKLHDVTEDHETVVHNILQQFFSHDRRGQVFWSSTIIPRIMEKYGEVPGRLRQDINVQRLISRLSQLCGYRLTETVPSPTHFDGIESPRADATSGHILSLHAVVKGIRMPHRNPPKKNTAMAKLCEGLKNDVAVVRREWGPFSPQLSLALRRYARTHLLLHGGNDRLAEAPLLQSTEIARWVYGDGSVEHAEALEELADAVELRSSSAALAILQRAQQIHEEASGYFDPKAVDLLSRMADLQEGICLKRALRLRRQHLFRCKQRLHHPTEPLTDEQLDAREEAVAVAQQRLASTLLRDGKFEPALELEVAILKHHLNKNQQGYFTVALSLCRIAQVKQALNIDDCSIMVDYREALAITEDTMGPMAPELAEVLDKVAAYHCLKENYDTALQTYSRALSIRENNYGRQHIAVSSTLRRMAMVWSDRQMYDRAMPLAKWALTSAQGAVGSNNDETHRCMLMIAALHTCLGRYDEAIAIHQDVLRSREETYGRYHPDTADSLHSIALLLKDQGNVDEALQLFEVAVTIRESALGSTHHLVADALKGCASCHAMRNDTTTALGLLKQALAIYELHPRHEDVLPELSNLLLCLGQVHYTRGEHSEAVKALERALILRRRLSGEDATSTPEERKLLAECRAEMQKKMQLQDTEERDREKQLLLSEWSGNRRRRPRHGAASLPRRSDRLFVLSDKIGDGLSTL